MDRERLFEILEKLGTALKQPTTLCFIGSAPAILVGQPERATQDIDVWRPASTFDAGDLAAACRAAGILFDPRGELDAGVEYLQIVRPGIVAMPEGFGSEEIDRFGVLTLLMPSAAALAASKLVRASEQDLADVVWWVRTRGLSVQSIAAEIERMEMPAAETARENLVLVRLVTGRSS